MKFIVDGYNLLHASPLLQTPQGPKWLEKQRYRLVSSLAALLSAAERSATVVVFDARESPVGVPSEYCFDGIVVRFARDHAEADDLIEELIQLHATPSSLTVVSSDLRLQRAAKKRKAHCLESRAWFDHLRDSRKPAVADTEAANPEHIKDAALDQAAIAHWMQEMGVANPSSAKPRWPGQSSQP